MMSSNDASQPSQGDTVPYRITHEDQLRGGMLVAVSGPHKPPMIGTVKRMVDPGDSVVAIQGSEERITYVSLRSTDVQTRRNGAPSTVIKPRLLITCLD